MFNQLKNINCVKHMFDTNNPLYFACLYPKYEWFYKEFSISRIVEPTKVKIVKTTFILSKIDNEDRFFLSKKKI